MVLSFFFSWPLVAAKLQIMLSTPSCQYHHIFRNRRRRKNIINHYPKDNHGPAYFFSLLKIGNIFNPCHYFALLHLVLLLLVTISLHRCALVTNYSGEAGGEATQHSGHSNTNTNTENYSRTLAPVRALFNDPDNDIF